MRYSKDYLIDLLEGYRDGSYHLEDCVKGLTSREQELLAEIAELRDLVALIRTDSFAATFQSLRQYRTALISVADGIKQTDKEVVL